MKCRSSCLRRRSLRWPWCTGGAVRLGRQRAELWQPTPMCHWTPGEGHWSRWNRRNLDYTIPHCTMSPQQPFSLIRGGVEAWDPASEIYALAGSTSSLWWRAKANAGMEPQTPGFNLLLLSPISRAGWLLWVGSRCRWISNAPSAAPSIISFDYHPPHTPIRVLAGTGQGSDCQATNIHTQTHLLLH